jgi:Protein of unknown function (DUF1236)
MNKTNLLVTSAVAAFVAATGASMAQQERTPQQEHRAPAEKVAPQNAPAVHNQAPSGRVGETPQNRGRNETTGQAPREDRQSRPSERNSEHERGKTGQAPREDRLNGAPEQNRANGQAPREDRTNRSSEQNRVEQKRGRTEENSTTTGQGAAGTRGNVTINLTPEKRTRIHEVIVNERNAPRVRSPKFNVSVGTRVPRTVRFAALPRTILEIEPEWRGFEYFMIGNQIVIVDPRSMEIVAIVEV